MNSDEKALQEALLFFDKLKPSFARYDQQMTVKALRNEVQADWLDSFMTTMNNNPSPLINKETGLKHTVDSLVAELQTRVGLDSLQKNSQTLTNKTSASLDGDEKQETDEDLLEKIKQHVDISCLRPTGGFISAESILNNVKDHFGDNIVEVFGRDELIEHFTKWRDDVRDTSDIESLPKYNGDPIPMSNEKNQQDNMFSNLAVPGK